MIPLPHPQRYVHGQAIRPDVLNQILDTLRRMQPIEGAGIRLNATPNGIIIAADRRAEVTPQPFNHPFKVTLATNPDGQQIATIAAGNLYTLTIEESGATATAQPITPGDGLTATATGWTATGINAQSQIYITHTQETGYTLCAGIAPAEVLFIIATLSGGLETGSPASSVSQRLLSDIYLADPEEDPAALLNQNLYTPELSLSYTEPVQASGSGSSAVEAKPAKIQLSIPYTNPKTGAGGTTTKTIKLTGLTGGGGAADLPEPVELTVVTGIEYANNQLTMKTQVVKAYLAAAPAAETTTTIFTATAHSEEHS